MGRDICLSQTHGLFLLACKTLHPPWNQDVVQGYKVGPTTKYYDIGLSNDFNFSLSLILS